MCQLSGRSTSSEIRVLLAGGALLVADVLPSEETFARDMGVWNIGLTLPQVLAAVFGGWLIGLGLALGSLQLGYTFLYWSDVVRPAGALNPAIDPRVVPGRPEFAPATATGNPVRLYPWDDFWAQGFSAGLRFQY